MVSPLPPAIGSLQCLGRLRAAVPRQIDGECAAGADPAVDIDAAAQVGDDAVHQRQPEPGAHAGGLGGEEGIEDALEHLRCDAGAGVAHGELDVAAGRQLRGRHALGFGQASGLQGHDQRSARAHRLHRVRAQIHHHLMNLCRVAEHRGIAGAEVTLEPHLRRQRRGGCHQRLVDDRLHVDPHAFTGAAAAERQDALDQRLRAQRGAHRGIDVPALRRAFGAVALHHLAVTEDRGEDVVEVVRDAAGQRAHRLELLRLAQLRFEPVALGLGVLAHGDVFERTGHPVRPALLVTQRDAALAEPAPAVRSLVVEPVLDLPVRASLPSR